MVWVVPSAFGDRQAVGAEHRHDVADRGGGDGELLAVALEDDGDRLVDAGADQRADVLGVVDRLAGDRHDAVTGLDAGSERRGLRLVGARGRVAGLGHRDHALRHRRHDGAGLCRGHPVHGDEEGEQHDADEEVHRRAAEHDGDLLRHREPVEDAVLVARAHLLQARGAGLVDELAEPAGARRPHRAGPVARARGEHADHPDVAAERNHLDAVLGLAAAPGPHRGPEADHVLGHPHAEPLGRHEVTDLVQGDRRGDTGGHEEDTEDEGER